MSQQEEISEVKWCGLGRFPDLKPSVLVRDLFECREFKGRSVYGVRALNTEVAEGLDDGIRGKCRNENCEHWDLMAMARR